MDYREAGVDVVAGRDFVNRIRDRVQQTYRPEVLGGLGGFGGCFELPSGYRKPVLVSGTDGVGTKLKLAHFLDRHDSVGIDLVAMCVNDVLTCGAEPLFFLDYLATGKLSPEQLSEVVSGIATGCEEAGCALLGGETAEMPGFYQPGEYDVAGFCVGIAEKERLIDGGRIEGGDVAIALASSGLHSNGFSLVRKIVAEGPVDWSDRPEELGGATVGEVCLSPTRIYVKPILDALREGLDIRGMAHITGGGLPENLPRCLPETVAVRIVPDSWPVPPIFPALARWGSVDTAAMLETFNLGVGFVLFVPPSQAEGAIARFASQNIPAYRIGEVVPGNRELTGLEDWQI